MENTNDLLFGFLLGVAATIVVIALCKPKKSKTKTRWTATLDISATTRYKYGPVTGVDGENNPTSVPEGGRVEFRQVTTTGSKVADLAPVDGDPLSTYVDGGDFGSEGRVEFEVFDGANNSLGGDRTTPLRVVAGPTTGFSAPFAEVGPIPAPAPADGGGTTTPVDGGGTTTDPQQP